MNRNNTIQRKNDSITHYNINLFPLISPPISHHIPQSNTQTNDSIQYSEDRPGYLGCLNA